MPCIKDACSEHEVLGNIDGIKSNSKSNGGQKKDNAPGGPSSYKIVCSATLALVFSYIADHRGRCHQHIGVVLVFKRVV